MIFLHCIQALENKVGMALQSSNQLLMIVGESLELESYFNCSSLLVDQNVLLGVYKYLGWLGLTMLLMSCPFLSISQVCGHPPTHPQSSK